MERLTRIGLVLLVLSLALNIALLTRVARIEDMINGRLMIDDQLRSLMSLTQQNSDRINQAMNTIETEQRWVTPVEIAGVSQAGSSSLVKLSWVIKDYPGGAPVTFHYRKRGDRDFTAKQAMSVGDGRFEVELADTMNPEPEMKLHSTYVEGSSGPAKAESATAIKPPQNMEYYITVKDGSRLKSSEIASLGMEKLSWGMYAPLSAEVQVNQAQEYYSVFLTQSPVEPTQVKLSRVFLEVYRGTELLTRNDLSENQAKPDQSVRMFNTQWNHHGQKFDRVFLTLEYENGKQFKKDITGSP